MDKYSQKTFDKLVARDVNSLNVDEKAFIRARSSYLTDEQKKKFESLFKKEQPKPAK